MNDLQPLLHAYQAIHSSPSGLGTKHCHGGSRALRSEIAHAPAPLVVLSAPPLAKSADKPQGAGSQTEHGHAVSEALSSNREERLADLQSGDSKRSIEPRTLTFLSDRP